jgi:uncharacterized delta-60 repeat protein
MGAFVAVVALSLLLSASALAAAGDLDSSLDGDGKLTTDISSGSNDAGWATAIDGMGRIIVAGTSAEDFAVARYNSDGSPDTTFSGDGKQTTDIGAGSADSGYAVAIDGIGRIVVVGSSADDFALVRYDSNGSLDMTFSGDGKQTTDIGAGSADFAAGVAIDGMQRIVVAGTSANDFALARYDSLGTPDASFSGDGEQTTDFNSGSNDGGAAVAIDASARIVVAGASANNFALARYSTTGSLDMTFSGDGKQTTQFGSLQNSFGNAIAIDGTGRIIVAGNSFFDFALARYNSDGSLDNTFDNDGRQTTDFGSGSVSCDFGNAVTVDAIGRIVVGGQVELTCSSNYDFALARYNSDGSLDTTFSDDGQQTTDIGSGGLDQGNAVAIDGLGRIVVAGFSESDFAVARYMSADSFPAPPTLTATNPPSGSNDNNPEIIGNADRGTTVTLYTNPTCAGAPVGTGSASTFASPGVTVSVADNSTITFYAKASNTAGTSACSTSSVTYSEVTPPSGGGGGGGGGIQQLGSCTVGGPPPQLDNNPGIAVLPFGYHWSTTGQYQGGRWTQDLGAGLGAGAFAAVLSSPGGWTTVVAATFFDRPITVDLSTSAGFSHCDLQVKNAISVPSVGVTRRGRLFASFERRRLVSAELTITRKGKTRVVAETSADPTARLAANVKPGKVAAELAVKAAGYPVFDHTYDLKVLKGRGAPTEIGASAPPQGEERACGRVKASVKVHGENRRLAATASATPNVPCTRARVIFQSWARACLPVRHERCSLEGSNAPNIARAFDCSIVFSSGEGKSAQDSVGCGQESITLIPGFTVTAASIGFASLYRRQIPFAPGFHKEKSPG